MNMSLKTCFGTAGMLAFPLLAGCGGSSSTTSAPTLTPRSVSATLSNGLTATLTEDRSTVPVGGTVNYTAKLTNNTAQPITFQYSVGPASIADVPGGAVPAVLVVSNPSGKNVSPPAGAAQFGITTPSFTLAPGQSLSASEAVSTSVSYNLVVGYTGAGTYTANAFFQVVPLTSADASQSIQATAGPLSVTVQ